MSDASIELGLPCVHCGLCLDTCPTYRVLGREADSPRGRIHIMEAVDAGRLELDRDAAAHLDGCLGCLACETACPSGVSFGTRIEAFRPRLAAALPLRPWRIVVTELIQRPALVRAAAAAAAVLDALGLGGLRRRLPALGLMPTRQRRSGAASASSGAATSRLDALEPLPGARRVAVLRGCVADALLPSVHRAAIDVLRFNGVDVVEIDDQCCGALAFHAGRVDEAQRLALATVRSVADLGVDRIVTTAAGCGAMMRRYPHVLGGADRDGSVEPAAIAGVASATLDVSELLSELGPRRPKRPLDAGSVAYHDACHLLHACGVASTPRSVVRAATGEDPIDLGENQLCCGSAGSYNLEHGAMAAQLGSRKAALAAEVKADTIAVGNVGCILQIERALAQAGLAVDVRHPVELLAEAYRREGGS